MDTKLRWLIERHLGTVRSGTYHEADVLGLLILLREHAPARSLVRELGDFVAHRERTKGILHDFLRAVDARISPHANPAPTAAITVPIYTSAEVHIALNEVLTRNGFDVVSEQLGKEITVCVISLLQSVRVQRSGPATTWGFSVGISSALVALEAHAQLPAGHIVRFPLLTAPNDFEPVSNMPVTMTLPQVVEASSLNGRLRLVQTRIAA